jgi:hypothetical protein
MGLDVVMIYFNFVLFLHLFCDLLGKVHVVSTQLPSTSVDLAAELINNLIASAQRKAEMQQILLVQFLVLQRQCVTSAI